MNFGDLGITALAKDGKVYGFEVRVPRPILRIDNVFKNDPHDGMCDRHTVFTDKEKHWIDYHIQLINSIPVEKVPELFGSIMMIHRPIRKAVANIRARKRLFDGDVNRIEIGLVEVQ